MKIFISSVQKEFAAERRALADYLRADPLLRRFFEVFLFEQDVPATDRTPDSVFLAEVADCDIYLGLFGREYGWQNADGLSPTHLEFQEASRLGKTRLIFVHGAEDSAKHPQMQALIREAGSQLVRRRFQTSADLLPAVYASLVDHLEESGKLNRAPWDARAARKATLDDLDAEGIARFVRHARKARNFPLPAETEPAEVLTHLNLLDDGQPTNAAILLFGKHPQRFCLPSEVKCAHFHGTEVAKPIPSYQVYKGTAFQLVDQAIDFVMSKINAHVGTREHGPQAPVTYEIPREVVAEAIVNAVAHRDYESNGSVQVMLFADRLEITNPGRLPKALTLEDLRRPHNSIPGNPLLAESLYLTKYIERMGTGTRDMIRLCTAAGLPEPVFHLADGFVTTIRRKTADPVTRQVTDPVADPVTRQVTGQVTGQVDPWIIRALVAAADKPLSSRDLQNATGIRHRETFQRNYLDLLLQETWVARTLPDKPNSRLQKYQLTPKGRDLLEAIQKEVKKP